MSYAFYYKNKYLTLTLRKLIGVEKEIGISSYINIYLNQVVKSDIFGIKEEYNILNQHLEKNYIFPVQPGDFNRTIESIFKSGDIYCISLIKSSKSILDILKDNLSKTKIKLIVPNEIISSTENLDFSEELRKYSGKDILLWRKGFPRNVFNVILSLKEKDGLHIPIRALKFEIGENAQIIMEHITTDEGSLKYWDFYFNQDWNTITNNIKKPLIELTGTAQIKNTIIVRV